jgi:hypothetical protein
LQRENQHSIQAQDGRPRIRRPCYPPLSVFNGTKNGPSKKGNDGDSYAVWRARLVIDLRARCILSIVTANDDGDDSDDDEIQPSVQRHQARAAHIMTSAPGTGPFLFFQGVNTILRPYSAYSTQVPWHRHVVCHVSRQRVRHQEVSSW